ncbi:armadillo-type protein [Mycena albidolilacea]|uniref:Armadillo-type protein n=1 Tax=Mycena albidolilacea TaxID=1033008 RepID=A0AAD7EEH3_9AGAR|nr:armadillo-type protein [Mycena albidolilacea]
MALASLSLSAQGAEAVIRVGNRMSDFFDEVLKISDQIPVCFLLTSLSRHESTRGFVLDANPYQHIVTLLSDKTTAGPALSTLRSIATCARAVQGVLDAGAIHMILKFLESADVELRRDACGLIRSLVNYESTVWKEVRCAKLVRLLSDDDEGVVFEAMVALSTIADSVDGAAAVVEAGALNRVDEFLQSGCKRLSLTACILLYNLADHNSKGTTQAILDVNPCPKIVLLLDLYRESPTYVRLLLRVLNSIVRSGVGARCVVEAGVLHVLGDLLQSSNHEVCWDACDLLSNLALDDLTLRAVLDSNHCQRLITLLSLDATGPAALNALDSLARSPQGTQAVLVVLPNILQSADSFLKRVACEFLNTLDFMTGTLSNANLLERLITLLRCVSFVT